MTKPWKLNWNSMNYKVQKGIKIPRQLSTKAFLDLFDLKK